MTVFKDNIHNKPHPVGANNATTEKPTYLKCTNELGKDLIVRWIEDNDTYWFVGEVVNVG